MDIQALQFEMSTVRMMVLDEEPWFVAQDVCSVLDHSDTSKAVSRLDDDEKLMRTMFVSGQQRPVWLVNEAGLYGLVMTSRLPKAKQFKRWVKHEVLPSIRKTGAYSVAPKSQAEALLQMAQYLVDQEHRMNKLETELQVATQRINSLDHVDVVGDKQQRLGAMVKKVAQQNGWTFQKAWREFTAAFNTAYRTNLTQRIEHYKEKHGLKDLSRPQYLSIVDQLDDAIRVADKMLNRVPVGV